MTFKTFDQIFIGKMRIWGVPTLRVALGFVFLWFGALKLAGLSPVAGMIGATYSFLPLAITLKMLGAWEMLVGLGLVFKIHLRVVLFLLWVHMAGTLLSLFLKPGMFFTHGNPLWLTMEGEFVIKNIILIACGLVIGGHEVE
ncbi:hypothetical protein HY224_02535 [Candidatus Uhrbacteria bacterium]|nr:hypothetical protein [Candidatus Uhrbacteria bacterium]